MSRTLNLVLDADFDPIRCIGLAATGANLRTAVNQSLAGPAAPTVDYGGRNEKAAPKSDNHEYSHEQEDNHKRQNDSDSNRG